MTLQNRQNDSAPKFHVGDKVFICDGGEHHGAVAIVTEYDSDTDRYYAVLGGRSRECHWTDPFFCKEETVFRSIEKGTCELCGSSEGIVKPPYPQKEFGDVFDLSVRKFPYAVACICQNCQKVFDLRDEKIKQRNMARRDFRDTEHKRRERKRLCEKCGGEISRSYPSLVYEGTYEITHRCNVCGFTESFT